EFLVVLLGDEPVLADKVTLYQRLAAKDQDEATQIVMTASQTQPVDELCDTLLLPALVQAARDRQRGLIEDDDEHFIQQATWEIVEEVTEKEAATAPGAEPKAQAAASRNGSP